MSNFLATILGNPDFPSIREVNVRSGPAITNTLLFKVPLGLKGAVIAAETDTGGVALNNKIYIWLHVSFTDGRKGWVRDDLIEVQGDGQSLGYGFVPQAIQAFRLIRTVAAPPPPPPVDPGTGDSQPKLLASILGDLTAPSIREVNVRAGAAVTNTMLFRVPLGLKGHVIAAESDQNNSGLNGKRYTWLQIEFEDGRKGWVRDDLIEIEGDGQHLGYGIVSQPTQAFKLTRGAIILPPVVEPPVVTPQPEEPKPPAPVFAFTMARDGVNVRRGAGTVYPAVTRFAYRTRCDILEARQEDNRASRFKWVNLQANGQSGWVREDYLRYEGDVSRFELANADAYPAPILNAHWVRDWNTDPNFAAIHYGWDFGANVGEPVLAGPSGGLVVQVVRCTVCSPDRPNVLSHGIRLNDPGVLQNPAWGYGYGNYVVVRYLSSELPASTRNELARRNLHNYHLFVIYAHLNTIDVAQGQTLTSGQRVGTCGNSGNSEAPHLHLEIRAWNNPAETSSGVMISNRMDPVILFRR